MQTPNSNSKIIRWNNKSRNSRRSTIKKKENVVLLCDLINRFLYSLFYQYHEFLDCNYRIEIKTIEYLKSDS